MNTKTIGECICGHEYELNLPESSSMPIPTEDIKFWMDKNTCPKCGVVCIMSVKFEVIKQ